MMKEAGKSHGCDCINLNLDKTIAMLITLGYSKPPRIVYSVEIVDHWKFLGVIIW